MIDNQSSCNALDSHCRPQDWVKPANPSLDFLKRIDRTWLAIGGIFLAIAIGLPSHWMTSVRFTATNLVSIFPFLLLSASVAGYLEAAGADRRSWPLAAYHYPITRQAAPEHKAAVQQE